MTHPPIFQVEGIYLENPLLVAIVAKLAWGESGSHPFSVLPRGIEDVVDAAIIVRFSFCVLCTFYRG